MIERIEHLCNNQLSGIYKDKKEGSYWTLDFPNSVASAISFCPWCGVDLEKKAMPDRSSSTLVEGGIETEFHGGLVALLPFSRVLFMTIEKTQGTAYFKPEELDKEAVYVRLDGPGLSSVWITDPKKMMSIWFAYKRWILSKGA